MIRINQLTKRFGRSVAADDVSIEIAAGESVALWGTNGAGKTTIIRCVLGLLSYDGTIDVHGLDACKQGKQARMSIGYVPQELGFYDDLRVAEAVKFFAKLKSETACNVSECLRRVGLTGHESKRIRELSGGMKQRLALAIALLGDPSILVLDEVTASLDAGGRDEFVALLAETIRNSRRCMLFASHRIEEIAVLATRVVSLDHGKVMSDLPTRDFVSHTQPADLLHLFLNPSQCAIALSLLQANGIDARLNGKGIFVPIVGTSRSAALGVLNDANIRVNDFELIVNRGAL